jgi:hypothetical protein
MICTVRLWKRRMKKATSAKPAPYFHQVRQFCAGAGNAESSIDRHLYQPARARYLYGYGVFGMIVASLWGEFCTRNRISDVMRRQDTPCCPVRAIATVHLVETRAALAPFLQGHPPVGDLRAGPRMPASACGRAHACWASPAPTLAGNNTADVPITVRAGVPARQHRPPPTRAGAHRTATCRSTCRSGRHRPRCAPPVDTPASPALPPIGYWAQTRRI